MGHCREVGPQTCRLQKSAFTDCRLTNSASRSVPVMPSVGCMARLSLAIRVVV
jgi:hypothetical protein